MKLFRFLSYWLWIRPSSAFLNWRIARMRRKLKQHWQAGRVGGGAVHQLGTMTEQQAIRRVELLKAKDEPIVYIDWERGFIAFGKMPEVYGGRFNA